MVEKLSVKAEITKKDAEKALAAFQDIVIETLAQGEKIQLVGFGTFEVVDRKARMGRNPKTNEEMPIPASKSPKLKFGKKVKDAVKAGE